MTTNIYFLLARQHFLARRLSELVYGAIEVRKGRLYVHYREAGRQHTRLAGDYSDALYNLLIRNNELAKSIKRALRATERSLKSLGYVKRSPAPTIIRNADFATLHLPELIHSLTALSGAHISLPNIHRTITGHPVTGLTELEVRTITNLKNAWTFVADPTIASLPTSLDILCDINYLLEETFFFSAGDLRDLPLTLEHTTDVPLPPPEKALKKLIVSIRDNTTIEYDKALDLALLVLEHRPFLAGNTATALIFANHFLISHGLGLLNIPAPEFDQFKILLGDFRATGDRSRLRGFLSSHIRALPAMR